MKLGRSAGIVGEIALFASVISLGVLMFWVNSSDGVLWQRTMIYASSSVS